MGHERVDLQNWTERFPIVTARGRAREFVLARQARSPERYEDDNAVERHVKLMSPGGDAITSPRHLAYVEQIRGEALSGRGLDAVATDVFVMAEGIPTNRAVTCIGGLPYWPRSRPWPTTRNGEALTFMAQFSFVDSADIVIGLPGDILLLFADGEFGVKWDCSVPEGLHFEWMRLRDVPLVEAADIPDTDWRIMPCYGHIHRTVNYLGAYDLVIDDYNRPYCIDILEGTKIGGEPRWIQNEEVLDGRFLCTLGSVKPVYDEAFPFINNPEPLKEDYSRRLENALRFGDNGQMYFSIDESGTIDWTDQCY